MYGTASWWTRSTLAAAMATLVSCGGGGEGGTPPPPPNGVPVAAAGANQLVTRGMAVTLDGSLSSDPDKDALTWTWRQVSGPDVTAGVNSLGGVAPSFVAPSQVATLEFDLTVSDGKDRSASRRVVVNVLEDAGLAIFVSGDAAAGGDGSQASPHRTIAEALVVAAGALERFDVYVMARAGGIAYDERAGTLVVPGGTSLYGGYGAGWIRDLAGSRTALLGATRAVELRSLPQDAWISGFEIVGSGSVGGEADAAALWVEAAASSTGTLFVEDSRLEGGDVAAGTPWVPGSSYGVVVIGAAAVELRRNTIVAGAGGEGRRGASGVAGVIGQGFQGGSGGAGGSGAFGGNGGNGLRGCSSPWVASSCTRTGGLGGSGGTSLSEGGYVGHAPSPLAAPGGAVGPGGGGAGYAFQYTEGAPNPPWRPGFQPGTGRWGIDGTHGHGGGGGGGGASSFWGYVGGAGGRGGHGGSAGRGGLGGGGGGASIGVWLDVSSATVADNTVTTAAGGRGAPGGDGGAGGVGAVGEGASSGDGGGAGARGGGGGTGGTGGKAGAGGGGPSFGIVVGAGTAATIGNNTITAGNGGDGGTNTGAAVGTTSGGEGGYSFAVYDLDVLDVFIPDLIGNQLGFGTGGLAGTPGGEAGAQGARNW